MKREILCRPCAKMREDRGQHPEDVAMGFKTRTLVLGRAEAPAGLGITINGELCPMAELHCDHCDAIIPDGQPAVAVTTWNTNREGEPARWEDEYIKWIV